MPHGYPIGDRARAPHRTAAPLPPRHHHKFRYRRARRALPRPSRCPGLSQQRQRRRVSRCRPRRVTREGPGHTHNAKWARPRVNGSSSCRASTSASSAWATAARRSPRKLAMKTARSSASTRTASERQGWREGLAPASGGPRRGRAERPILTNADSSRSRLMYSPAASNQASAARRLSNSASKRETPQQPAHGHLKIGFGRLRQCQTPGGVALPDYALPRRSPPTARGQTRAPSPAW